MGASCFNCGAECTDDHYCHGCRAHICNACSVNPDASGIGHAPEDHLSDPELDEEG